jgi:hypothetical protein
MTCQNAYWHLAARMSWLNEKVRRMNLRRMEPPLYRTNISGI